MWRFRGRLGLVLVVLMVGLAGCVTDPVTGQQKLSFMSRDQEIQLGQEGEQEILAEYGEYDDQALAAHVNQLGQAIAAVSDDPSYPYKFHVLDATEVNAFSLPGGPVFVTRGLLEYIQNDAQLALVLGHEIGHVTAHHASRQYADQQLLSLGIGLGSVFFPQVRPFLGAVQTGAQLLLLKYSRDDESEADELGVRYATRAGYQAAAGAAFFESLGRIQAESGEALPTFLETHPDPGDRQATITSRSAYWAQQVGGTLGGTDSSTYIPMLQNVVFGENPRNGFVSGNTFYYPGPEGQTQQSFQFTVPSGWAVANLATQVQMAPNTSNPNAAIVMTVDGTASPSSAAADFISQNQAQVVSNSSTTVNGYAAQRVISNINVDDGQGGTATLTVMSYFISKSGQLYIFHGYSDQASFSSYSATFEGVFTSFREVTDASALSVRPFRMHVFQAPTTGSFESLVHPNAQAKADVNELAIINQRQPGDIVQAGAWLKEVTGP
jgi:predicted Zn-dependent protease